MNRFLFVAPALAYLLYRVNSEPSTTKIDGENAISELEMVSINNTKLAVMIRGENKDNPVLLCITGGPCGTDIPILKKYEQELEKYFTIVHYDQRGAGKSFSFAEDYSKLTYEDHVKDLISLSEFLMHKLNKDKLYLLGHSYGTYLGTIAASRKPEYYKAYIGIGQMSDTSRAEYYTLLDCLNSATQRNNKEDVKALEKIKDKVKNGEMYVPRIYISKYGFATKSNKNESYELMKNIITGPEYNPLDGFKFFYSASKNSLNLAMQAIKNPLTKLVKKLDIPTYFVLGKYDGMTNARAAKEYFDVLEAKDKKYIIFENSAHSPQIEENDKFVKWMISEFTN